MTIRSFVRKAKEPDATPIESRKENRYRRSNDDETNWLVSYADMMTLLCAFFVMMFSMAKLNAPEYEKVKKELATHFGGDYQSPNAQTAKFVSQVMSEIGADKDTVVTSDATGTTVVFHSATFFNTLSADLRDSTRKTLLKLIRSIQARQDAELKHFKIVVEGHTDGRPILGGIYPTNWELSSARAGSVVRLFVENGFSSQQMMAIGYGDTRPKYRNRTPSGTWDSGALHLNRRVVIRILEPETQAIPWEKGTPAQLPEGPESTGK